MASPKAMSITITDPLVKYHSWLTTGLIAPDAAQHRLARHLHKIYLRLKDYSPPVRYRERLDRILDAEAVRRRDDGPRLATQNHPIWRNPLFNKFLSRVGAQEPASLALARIVSDREAAVEIDSPRGLFLSGDVGTGKSMLVDLLCGGLPTDKKRRWHFNTFMLYAFSQLEKFRQANPSLANPDNEYSLLWMARKLVDESPILFLDEFQMPDRAASKILSHLFVSFFQLGGVLVASSNRMPEELQRAIGVDYSSPDMGLAKRFLSTTRSRGELYGGTSDFAAFLEVLKARCDFWNMEGARDWRRVDAEVVSPITTPGGLHDAVQQDAFIALSESEGVSTADVTAVAKRPPKYFLASDDPAEWLRLVAGPVSEKTLARRPWEETTLSVYGRTVAIPRHLDGHVLWDFEDLVRLFGPADYITMASTFDTFIIDKVPILDLSMKNEARRFITLLDALYEAKCKLIIRAETVPDELFFPETRRVSTGTSDAAATEDGDATYSETIAEVYQDQMSPFRPNISYYDTSQATSKYDPDQDSDFGLDRKEAVDFANAGAFTGEDERFAYKRATSRLWELCGSRWHARTGNWWQPLPREARHWEQSVSTTPRTQSLADTGLGSDLVLGPSVELDEQAGLQKLSVEHLRKKYDGK